MSKRRIKRKAVTRRDVIKLGAMLSGAAALSPILQGCGPQETPTTSVPEPEGLTGKAVTWYPATRDDAISSEKWRAEQFMAEYPGVTIEQLLVPHGEDIAKLKAAHEADTAPDTVWAYSDLLYTYGLEGFAQSTDDVLEEIGLDRYPSGVLDAIRVEGKYYTIPFVGFPFFIYYRKDLYEKKGLKPPETHEEFIENIKALHNPPETYGYLLNNAGFADNWNLKTAMWTHGAYYFDEKDNVALDRPETIEAWKFYKELGKYTSPGSMAQYDLECRSLMLDGKVAHMLTTTSFAENFKEEDLERQGALVYPIRPGAKGASLDLYGFILTAKAKNPDVAKEVLKFYMRPDILEGYLIRTIIGWVPMVDDAWTETYLNHPRIAPVREYLEVGREAQKQGIIGSGYFGPSKKAPVLVATDVEVQIGDRLVTLDQDPEEVLEWAIGVIEKDL